MQVRFTRHDRLIYIYIDIYIYIYIYAQRAQLYPRLGAFVSIHNKDRDTVIITTAAFSTVRDAAVEYIQEWKWPTGTVLATLYGNARANVHNLWCTSYRIDDTHTHTCVLKQHDHRTNVMEIWETYRYWIYLYRYIYIYIDIDIYISIGYECWHSDFTCAVEWLVWIGCLASSFWVLQTMFHFSFSLTRLFVDSIDSDVAVWMIFYREYPRSFSVVRMETRNVNSCKVKFESLE